MRHQTHLKVSPIAITIAMLLLGACRTSPPPDPLRWFDDTATAAGLHFSHRRADPTRLWLPEIMTGGACLIDFDRDGWLDLFLTQSNDLDPAAPRWNQTSRLFRNLGDGHFSDITEAAGVGVRVPAMGCAVGDIDGDGFEDLYVTVVGPNILFRNRNGKDFEDVTAAAAVGDPRWSSSAAFFDFDQDGDLDLFVVNYIGWSPSREPTCYSGGSRDYCSPKSYSQPEPDRLYQNDGSGRFHDVSHEVGLGAANGNGLGVVVADFDRDGWLDVYVANDGTPNQLWLNRDGRHFDDVAIMAGVAVNANGAAQAGMGVVAFDLEDDGDTDLFITHLAGETNALYTLTGEGPVFEDLTARAGLAASSLAFTGFGVGVHDFDGDGLRDIFVANGRVARGKLGDGVTDPYAEPDALFQGKPGGGFSLLPASRVDGHGAALSGRAAAFGDVDNDGDVDIVVANNGGGVRLLTNRAAGRNWLSIRVRERNGSDALGATLEVSALGRTQRALVQVASSYAASNDPRVHLWIGATSSAEVRVRWLDGETESFGTMASGSHELRRGARDSEP